MDLPPVLIALGASVSVAGPTGTRTIAVEDLFAGYYETVLAKNELIAELRVPAQGKTRAAYLKVTTGSAEDWPALGVAVALEAEAARQVGARRYQRRDREGDPPQERRAGARRRAPWTTRRSRVPAKPRPRRPNACPTSAARPPTSASSFASMWAARCGKHFRNKRSPATERLDP